MSVIKIASAQINPTIGDLDYNVCLMRNVCASASTKAADLVVFPELALTGYYPGDLLDEPAFLTATDNAFSQMLSMSKAFPAMAIAFGLPLPAKGPGKGLNNALAVIKDGEVVATYAKQLLPTYNIFDERRHFEPGPDRACTVEIAGVSVGFIICEDGWNSDGLEYAVNPLDKLGAADLVVSLNASPSNIGKRAQRHSVFQMAVNKLQKPLLYVNQVGGQDSLVYDGASFAIEPAAGVVWEAQRFQESLEVLTFNKGHFYSEQGTALPPVQVEGLGTMEFYRRQIVLGLKDYVRRCGFTKVVVGSSGGIDSALTLALAVEALGPDNVSAITMPSVFSSEGSVSDSQALCDNLGITLLHHSIKPIVERYAEGFSSSFAKPLEGLPLENLQARVRGAILMEYSNAFGHMLLTTGNKSEISVGYCTLYGDTNGGLGLIGDLYKTEVFELCRHLNKTAGREIVPVAIIDKPPSAELAPGQQDTDSLPPYEVLDNILRVFIEGDCLSQEEHVKANAVVAALKATEDGQLLLKKIRLMISRNEYKRRQAPPLLRLRGRAFGSGRQMPIAAKTNW